MKKLLSTDDVKKKYNEMLPVFEDICGAFHKTVPNFSTQSPQSLVELYLLTVASNPNTIFELGTGHRASTLAISMAALTLGHPVKMISLDITTPRNLPTIVERLSVEVSHDLSHIDVEDVTKNAMEFTIPDEWKRPIFTFYDAHDSPKYKIFQYASSAWFPKLAGFTVAVHDCSVTKDPINITLPDHRIIQHFDGRYMSGFEEIVPIVEWMNENKIEFSRPIDELGGTRSSVIYFNMPEAN